MLKLKLQYFDHLMQSADSLENTLKLEKLESKRRREWERMRWLDRFTNSKDMDLSQFCERVEKRGAWHTTIHEVTKSWTWLSDWTTTTSIILFLDPSRINHLWRLRVESLYLNN